MKFQFWGAGLIVLAAVMGGCNKSSSDSDAPKESAVTPQTYPAPGLTFYSDANYTNVDIDDSIHFGNRVAVLYYLGGSGFQGRNATTECNQFQRAGRNAPPPLASSQLGGFENRWRTAGTRRYGRVNSRRGETLGNVQSWKLHNGQNLTQLQGGFYVVCLMDRRRRHDSMGIFFEANAQMQAQVAFNMSFSNYQASFSGAYYGPKYQPMGRGVVR